MLAQFPGDHRNQDVLVIVAVFPVDISNKLIDDTDFARMPLACDWIH
ncbi:hypothetical protein PTRG_02531 [Pyrenophora tritici-repentis Pt-1C-BFP]|uniref:Uncharacterized protein n=1 Tax=Pyrenophora tritici-repentis (strain Pt-1C-BFP) TaxID=426418 RepID=B2VYP1_PYRTR|nr:uncharacterized protein PTRG_02531 [Pyrenophora tritici-repentis Pt-1C-BFP]EDU45054.1 hypothetical protein PTRG_02531 [Pyrenophora tritici-repentis Pt-1C-BFP]